MALNEVDLKEKLINEDPTFARLASKHKEYDDELLRLAKQPFLTPDEQMKETQLKKKKLQLKDKMARIMWTLSKES